MEINLVRKETFGTGSNTSKTETETLVKYEVMDGCPAQGEQVPIRMYMNGVQLTPSYKNIHNRLSVKYSINLILVDEEDRKYFKQTEIIIYRKPVWCQINNISIFWLTMAKDSYYHLNPPAFDLLIEGEAVEPPLLLNCPLWPSTSLSCCIFSSLHTFEYFSRSLFYYIPLSLVCSSLPVLIFFCSARISASCLLFNLFIAVSIFKLRLLNHF